MSGLYINDNSTAVEAYNNLDATSDMLSSAVNKLSSGLNIQTAADDPAGYLVGQYLQEESNGYGQAISNAQDAVSVLQTAEGALNQEASVLQTMNTLANQAANGGVQDGVNERGGPGGVLLAAVRAGPDRQQHHLRHDATSRRHLRGRDVPGGSVQQRQRPSGGHHCRRHVDGTRCQRRGGQCRDHGLCGDSHGRRPGRHCDGRQPGSQRGRHPEPDSGSGLEPDHGAAEHRICARQPGRRQRGL